MTYFLPVYMISMNNFLNRLFNGCDDQPIYMFFVKNLIENGEINSIYSLRRLVMSGLWPSLQASAINPLSYYNLNAFDTILVSALLYFAFCVGPNYKLKVLPYVLVLFICLFHSFFGPINSSPIATQIFLVWLFVKSLFWTLNQNLEKSKYIYLLLGGFVSLSFAVRSYVGVFTIILLFFAFLFLPIKKFALERIFQIFFGFMIVYLPWSLIQLRDSGTTSYPPFRGFMSNNFVFEGQREAVTFVDSLNISWNSLLFTNWIYFLGFLLFLQLFLVLFSNSFTKFWFDEIKPQFPLFIVFLSLIVFFFAFNYNERRSGPAMSHQRYWVPIFVGCLCFVFDYLSDGFNSKLTFKVILIFFVIILFVVQFKPTLNKFNFSNIHEIRVFNSQVVENRSLDESKYAMFSNLIRDSRVLTAIDSPSQLVDFVAKVEPLDLPGMVIPGRSFPFASNFSAQIDWLKNQNYDYFIVTEPNQGLCLYDKAGWVKTSYSNNASADWAPYMLSWFNFIENLIEQKNGLVGRVGSDFVFDVKSVER